MNLSPIVDHGYMLGLGDDDHPQYLHLNKAAQTLLQNLAVAGGVTIDGVDISAHAANVAAHHARYTDGEAVIAAEAEDPFDHAGDVNIGGDLRVLGGIAEFGPGSTTALKGITWDSGPSIAWTLLTLENDNGLMFQVSGAGNVIVQGTVDGVDISAHATNASAHHPDDQIDTKGNFLWTAGDNPRSFPLGVSCSFVRAAEGWPHYGSVLNVSGYSAAQDGSVLQLYSPYNEANGGKYLRYRTGLYDNMGWTGWKTVADTPPDVKARAWRNGLQVIVTGTTTIVQLANESYDPGTNYSTATYRFTAPYSGYYDFSVAAIFSKDHPVNNLPSPKVYQLFLYKNNAIRINNAGVHSSWGGAVGCTVADIHYLAATDFVDMRVWHNAGVNIELWGEEHSTYMAIHLESIV